LIVYLAKKKNSGQIIKFEMVLPLDGQPHPEKVLLDLMMLVHQEYTAIPGPIHANT